MSLQPIPSVWRQAVCADLHAREKRIETTNDFYTRWQEDFPGETYRGLLHDFEDRLSRALQGCPVTMDPPARAGETWEFWFPHGGNQGLWQDPPPERRQGYRSLLSPPSQVSLSEVRKTQFTMKTKTPNRERIEIRPATVTIPTPDGRLVAERITVDVPMRWDPELAEWLLDSDAIELLEATKTRHMGLMLPGELRALRERLGMTQCEIGTLLRIGSKSWTRWETGLQRPSQVINLLLTLLAGGIVSPRQLEQIGAEPADWSRQFLHLAHGNPDQKPVAMDRLRATEGAAWAEPMAIPA